MKLILCLSFLFACKLVAMNVNINCKLESPAITLNAPVYFDLEIVNDSGETIVIDLGHNHQSSLSFTIGTPDGRVVEVPGLSSSGIGSIGRVEVGPAGKYTRKYLLNQWYEFPAPGEYSIEAHLNAPIVSASGQPVKPTLTGTMKLTVTAKDPQTLTRICEQLLSNISHTTDTQEGADAARALSYVHDPIAVPYIKEALKQRRYSWQHLIPGLARIGNQDAIEILKGIEKQGDDEAGAALARYYLEALSPDATPEVRERLHRDPYR